METYCTRKEGSELAKRAVGAGDAVAAIVGESVAMAELWQNIMMEGTIRIRAFKCVKGKFASILLRRGIRKNAVD
ncbi:MAG: hypothetical protein DMF03_03640 [Verrucomicrobia bacterium]|nr:MAG: hypothetical protein DMF03_03640 [Verrucomicrobiota bacterium]